MAKRKLYGAALAAHNRKRSRSGGGGSTALARRSGSNITVRVAGGKPAKKTHRRRRHGGGSGTSMHSKLWLTGTAVGWGWLKGNKADMLAKVPTVQALGLEGTVGVGLHFLLPYIPAGPLRKAADNLSSVTLVLAGEAFGKSNFTSATVSGDDMSGPLDDDVGEYDDAGDDYE